MKSRRNILAAATLLLIGTSWSAQASDVPEQLRAPADQVLLLQASAKGVQIYECVAGADQSAQLEWKLKAPDAELFDKQGKKIGKHYAGPTWELNDGTSVVGMLKVRNESPDSRAIPWLLLDAKSTSGSGTLGATKSIQRLNTTGGKAPGDPCTQGSAGRQARVTYTADYYFYGAKH